MVPTYTLSAKAYVKIILHAAKHPTTTVNGVLLGEDKAPTADDAATIAVMDAIPLFHRWTMLSPMLEVGMEQIDTYASAHNLRIIGYYQANEVDVSKTLTPLGAKIAGKIKDVFGANAVAFVVNNAKLLPTEPEVAVLPYVHRENQWRPVQKAFTDDSPSAMAIFRFGSANAVQQAAHSILEKHFQYLHDFDEHLEDVSLDWIRNRKVAELAKV